MHWILNYPPNTAKFLKIPLQEIRLNWKLRVGLLVFLHYNMLVKSGPLHDLFVVVVPFLEIEFVDYHQKNQVYVLISVLGWDFYGVYPRDQVLNLNFPLLSSKLIIHLHIRIPLKLLNLRHLFLYLIQIILHPIVLIVAVLEKVDLLILIRNYLPKLRYRESHLLNILVILLKNSTFLAGDLELLLEDLDLLDFLLVVVHVQVLLPVLVLFDRPRVQKVVPHQELREFPRVQDFLLFWLFPATEIKPLWGLRHDRIASLQRYHHGTRHHPIHRISKRDVLIRYLGQGSSQLWLLNREIPLNLRRRNLPLFRLYSLGL